ncbi:Processing alpha glucosidase I, partial [Borealophlyctis nickersoniae]
MFGSQEIADRLNNVSIKTEFLKRPGAYPHDATAADVSVMFYVGLEGEGKMQLDKEDVVSEAAEDPVMLHGHVKDLGDFAFVVTGNRHNAPPPTGPYPANYDLPDLYGTRVARLKMPKGEVWKIKDALQENIVNNARQLATKYPNPFPSPPHLFTVQDTGGSGPNVFVFQKTLRAPFEFDIAFISQSARQHEERIKSVDADSISGNALTSSLKAASESFDDRFEKTFHLTEKGFSAPQVAFAQSMLGNMVGGLGYFHGTSIVDRALEDYEEDEPTDYLENEADEPEDDYFGDSQQGEKRPQPNPQLEGPTTLFTGVPSRPFFPRGFLWDEGFHQLLIGAWDNDLSLDIISHWASLIDDRGWVGREQILGEEARSKVPKEFQTQYSHFANPPTLILSVKKYIERLRAVDEVRGVKLPGVEETVSSSDPTLLSNYHLTDKNLAVAYLKSVYPKFKKQYYWFRKTQWGHIDDWGRKTQGGEG